MTAPPSGDRGRPPGRRFGVDVGQVRVGVAQSDPDGTLATPVATLDRDPDGADLHALAELTREHDSPVLYVGLPRSLDGAEREAARRARAYAAALEPLVAPTRVRLVDERLTTVQSHRQLRASGRPGRSHRAVVDQVAAVLILQSALDHERSTGQEAGEPATISRRRRTKGRG